MAHGTTTVVAALVAVLLFAAMMAFRTPLAERQSTTILGGFMGSNVFVFLLTAVSNFEMDTFGTAFQAKLFPEVIVCLLMSMLAAGMVHRVSVTVCVLFSLAYLFAMSTIGINRYSAPVTNTPQVVQKKRK